MDIQNSFLDIHNSFLDIQKSIYEYPKIHFWISKKSVDYWISIIKYLDIQKWIMDILKYTPIFGYP